MRVRFVGFVIAISILIVLVVSQAQAQSSLTLEGLSSQLSTLRGRIASLSNNKADRSELQALTFKVATFEARLDSNGSVPTRRLPTSTPTRPRSTAASTPEKPSIAITRPMNIRSGPSTDYDIVGVANAGSTFFVSGKNADGSWWRIFFEGKSAWVYAPYVQSANTDRVGVVATPTLSPTRTPRPKSTPSPSGESSVVESALIVILSDQRSMGKEQEWHARSQSSKDEAVVLAATLLDSVASYCDLSVAYTAALVDSYGDFLDQQGFTKRNPLFPVRQLMLFSVQAVMDEYPRRPLSCDAMFEAVSSRLLEEE